MVHSSRHAVYDCLDLHPLPAAAAAEQATLSSIPPFYFPAGAEPLPSELKQQFMVRVGQIFDPHPQGLNLEQFSTVVQEVRQHQGTAGDLPDLGGRRGQQGCGTPVNVHVHRAWQLLCRLINVLAPLLLPRARGIGVFVGLHAAHALSWAQACWHCTRCSHSRVLPPSYQLQLQQQVAECNDLLPPCGCLHVFGDAIGWAGQGRLCYGTSFYSM